MINKLIEFCANNRFIVLLFVSMAVFAGLYSIRNINLDAVPDLSDTQVIIYTRWDRSPDIIEDQVTYPIATEMLKVPGARTVRGYSFFGVSFVYLIFDDGVDLYWARSRVLEYLSAIRSKLPATAETALAVWEEVAPGQPPLELRHALGVGDPEDRPDDHLHRDRLGDRARADGLARSPCADSENRASRAGRDRSTPAPRSVTARMRRRRAGPCTGCGRMRRSRASCAGAWESCSRGPGWSTSADRPSAAATWVMAVSQEMTRSRLAITAAVSRNASGPGSSSGPRRPGQAD